MARKHTILEIICPAPVAFGRLARAWSADAATLMMGWVWAGYDLLAEEVLCKTDWTSAGADLERELTQLLEPRIRHCMPSDAFCYVQHGPNERETRKPAPAQPPEYDLAFVLYANERIMWPLEAKVLPTDQQVDAYVKDVKNEFLTCRYAPFSEEGAMLGYMLSGCPLKAFAKIAQELGVMLVLHPDFARRHHRVSSHIRSVPSGKRYPKRFRCHHLMMPLQ